MAVRPKKVRDLLCIDDLDKRTQVAERTASLRDQIIADKGGRDRLSALEYEQVENAAMTSAVLRSVQCRWAKDEQISDTERQAIATMSTLQNTFNRLVETIGLGREPKDVTSIDAIIQRANEKLPA